MLCQYLFCNRYNKLARHFGWAFEQLFTNFKMERAIVIEDDLEIAIDFFEYFFTMLPILDIDTSVWTISAWNDNGTPASYILFV